MTSEEARERPAEQRKTQGGKVIFVDAVEAGVPFFVVRFAGYGDVLTRGATEYGTLVV